MKCKHQTLKIPMKISSKMVNKKQLLAYVEYRSRPCLYIEKLKYICNKICSKIAKIQLQQTKCNFDI